MADFGSSTKTTVGTAVIALVFLVGGVWRIERGFSSLAEAQASAIAPVVKSQDEMRSSLQMIDFRLRLLETTGAGAVPMPTFRAWVADFKERNPSVSVPSVQ